MFVFRSRLFIQTWDRTSKCIISGQTNKHTNSFFNHVPRECNENELTPFTLTPPPHPPPSLSLSATTDTHVSGKDWIHIGTKLPGRTGWLWSEMARWDGEGDPIDGTGWTAPGRTDCSRVHGLSNTMLSVLRKQLSPRTSQWHWGGGRDGGQNVHLVCHTVDHVPVPVLYDGSVTFHVARGAPLHQLPTQSLRHPCIIMQQRHCQAIRYHCFVCAYPQ